MTDRKKKFPPKSVGAWRSAALLTLLRGYKAMPGYIAASRPKVIIELKIYWRLIAFELFNLSVDRDVCINLSCFVICILFADF